MILPVYRLIQQITRIARKVEMTSGLRRSLWRQLMQGIPRLNVPIPRVQDLLTAATAGGWGIRYSVARGQIRRMKEVAASLPRQRALGIEAVIPDEDIAESALPITAPYQYEFELEIRGQSGNPTGDWNVRPIRYNSPDKLTGGAAMREFKAKFKGQFMAKWDDMKFTGVTKRSEEP